MHLELNEQQYRELALLVSIGSYIRGGVDDMEGAYTRETDALQEYILSHAKDFNAEDLVERFEKYVVPSRALTAQYHDYYIEEHDDDHFWHMLEMMLGQRDFAYHASEEEKEKVRANDGWMAGIVEPYYERYEEEFETYGIERLRIVDITMQEPPKEKRKTQEVITSRGRKTKNTKRKK
jgi:hypothetical protein